MLSAMGRSAGSSDANGSGGGAGSVTLAVPAAAASAVTVSAVAVSAVLVWVAGTSVEIADAAVPRTSLAVTLFAVTDIVVWLATVMWTVVRATLAWETSSHNWSFGNVAIGVAAFFAMLTSGAARMRAMAVPAMMRKRRLLMGNSPIVSSDGRTNAVRAREECAGRHKPPKVRKGPPPAKSFPGTRLSGS